MDRRNEWHTEIGKTNDEGLDPNGMWCVIWAMGMFVFPIFTYLTNFLFSLANTTTNVHDEQCAEMGNNEQGPNDTRCVVWAMGMFLFLYITISNLFFI